MIDKTTVEKAIDGDDVAYLVVVEDSLPTIRKNMRPINRIEQMFDTVEDAVHSFVEQKFERIIANYDFESKASFETYLARSVRNFILNTERSGNAYKRDNNVALVEDDTLARALATEGDSVPKQVDKSLLRDVLEDLPEDEMIAIFKFFGLDGRDRRRGREAMSREMCIPRYHLYRLVRRGVRRLRKMLGV